jgi:hypothetical protein
MNFKGVTSGQRVVDVVPFDQVLTGGSLRPLSPVILQTTRYASGDWPIHWMPRTRNQAGMFPGAAGPGPEPATRFVIRVYNGVTVVFERTITDQAVQAPTLLDYAPKDSSGVKLSSYDVSVENLDMQDAFVEATVAVTTPVNSTVGLTDFNLFTYGVVTHPPAPLITGATTQFSILAGVDPTTGFYVYEQATNGAALVNVYNQGVADANSTEKVRISVKDGIARYYLNYQNSGSLPLYTSTNQNMAGRDMRAVFSDHNVPSRIVNQSIDPSGDSFIYTLAQQTADFGSGQSTISVQISQVNQYVGNGPFAAATLP